MNPNGLPFQSPPGAPPPPSAQQALNVPALLLLVFGALTLVTNVVSGVSSLLRETQPDLPELLNQLRPVMALTQVPASTWEPMVTGLAGGAGTVITLVGLVLALVMTVGAWQMRQLRTYPVALAACVIAILPVGPCCCCLTLPFGVWGLVVLVRPEVRAQFS
jgi:hypothetical protein